MNTIVSYIINNSELFSSEEPCYRRLFVDQDPVLLQRFEREFFVGDGLARMNDLGYFLEENEIDVAIPLYVLMIPIHFNEDMDYVYHVFHLDEAIKILDTLKIPRLKLDLLFSEICSGSDLILDDDTSLLGANLNCSKLSNTILFQQMNVTTKDCAAYEAYYKQMVESSINSAKAIYKIHHVLSLESFVCVANAVSERIVAWDPKPGKSGKYLVSPHGHMKVFQDYLMDHIEALDFTEKKVKIIGPKLNNAETKFEELCKHVHYCFYQPSKRDKTRNLENLSKLEVRLAALKMKLRTNQRITNEFEESTANFRFTTSKITISEMLKKTKEIEDIIMQQVELNKEMKEVSERIEVLSSAENYELDNICTVGADNCSQKADVMISRDSLYDINIIKLLENAELCGISEVYAVAILPYGLLVQNEYYSPELNVLFKKEDYSRDLFPTSFGAYLNESINATQRTMAIMRDRDWYNESEGFQMIHMGDLANGYIHHNKTFMALMRNNFVVTNKQPWRFEILHNVGEVSLLKFTPASENRIVRKTFPTKFDKYMVMYDPTLYFKRFPEYKEILIDAEKYKRCVLYVQRYKKYDKIGDLVSDVTAFATTLFQNVVIGTAELQQGGSVTVHEVNCMVLAAVVEGINNNRNLTSTFYKTFEALNGGIITCFKTFLELVFTKTPFYSIFKYIYQTNRVDRFVQSQYCLNHMVTSSDLRPSIFNIKSFYKWFDNQLYLKGFYDYNTSLIDLILTPHNTLMSLVKLMWSKKDQENFIENYGKRSKHLLHEQDCEDVVALVGDADVIKKRGEKIFERQNKAMSDLYISLTKAMDTPNKVDDDLDSSSTEDNQSESEEETDASSVSSNTLNDIDPKGKRVDRSIIDLSSNYSSSSNSTPTYLPKGVLDIIDQVDTTVPTQIAQQRALTRPPRTKREIKSDVSKPEVVPLPYFATNSLISKVKSTRKKVEHFDYNKVTFGDDEAVARDFIDKLSINIGNAVPVIVSTDSIPDIDDLTHDKTTRCFVSCKAVGILSPAAKAARNFNLFRTGRICERTGKRKFVMLTHAQKEAIRNRCSTPAKATTILLEPNVIKNLLAVYKQKIGIDIANSPETENLNNLKRYVKTKIAIADKLVETISQKKVFVHRGPAGCGKTTDIAKNFNVIKSAYVCALSSVVFDTNAAIKKLNDDDTLSCQVFTYENLGSLKHSGDKLFIDEDTTMFLEHQLTILLSTSYDEYHFYGDVDQGSAMDTSSTLSGTFISDHVNPADIGRCFYTYRFGPTLAAFLNETANYPVVSLADHDTAISLFDENDFQDTKNLNIAATSWTVSKIAEVADSCLSAKSAQGLTRDTVNVHIPHTDVGAMFNYPATYIVSLSRSRHNLNLYVDTKSKSNAVSNLRQIITNYSAHLNVHIEDTIDTVNNRDGTPRDQDF